MSGDAFQEKFSRRRFLGAAAGVAGAFGAGALIDACGSSSSSGSGSGAQSSSSGSAGKPKQGGTLTAGFTGGSSSDTVDGFNVYTTIDLARTSALFEPLVQFEANGQIANRMAEEFVPNANGTVWTIRIRDGLTFHDGKPVTADDVIFSFQHMLDPKAPTLGSAAMVAVDPHGLKKLDARTVRVKMTMPQTTLKEQMSSFLFPVVPVGYNPKRPIGTGAFKLDSFEPGQRSVMSRFGDYFLSPMPYFDQLIIEDFPTSTSQLNALTGGQINAAGAIPWVSAGELASQSNIKVINERSGQWLEYPMRTDKGPTADVRVRQALRLLVDRTEFVSNVFSGQGILGNDIFSRFDPNYNSDLPQRVQDVGKAKSLLKAAGMENYAFTLVSGPWTPGLLEGAQLIAQQAASAGVKITVQNTPVGQFVAQDYLKVPFGSGYWYDNKYAAQAVLTMTRAAGQNETHWANPQWNSLWIEGNKTSDPSKYRDIVHQMQAIEWNSGGMIIPGFYNSVDGVSTNVQGFDIHDTIGPLGGPHFELGWIG
jgi:peptide/nickel transport system substrate-binding protein